MNKGRLVGSLVLVAAIVAGVLVATAGFGAAPRLGLDLRGGISVILTPQVAPGEQIDDDVLNETISVIRNRVDRLGVAEPEIARQGDDVLVQLPGLRDRERALEIIGRTAKLTFRPVEQVYVPGDPQYDEVGPDCGAVEDLTGDDDETTEGTSPAPEETTTPAPTEGGDAGDEEATGGDVTAAATSEVLPVTRQTEEGQDDGGEDITEEPTGEEPAGEAGEAETPAEPAPAGRPGERLEDDEPYILCGSPDAEGDETAAGPTPAEPLKYQVGAAPLTGEGIADALATPEQTGQGGFTTNWVVQLDLTGQGGATFAEITGELACERDQGAPGGGRLAIVLDGVVESAPEMNPSVQCSTGITGGTAVITVGGAEEDARDLALVLKTGALPITLEPSTATGVSPTLGAQSLRAGIIAGLIGLLLVALYLTFMYRWLGAVAIGGLAVFGVLIVGIITGLGVAGFTLTLAGVAGIIVSIGIAADSSILYFERIQDELETGKTVRTSVRRAFAPAFRTNLTGNTVTIAAAIVLYFLAVGPVRGFAFTLGLSTALDLVILYFFTRPAVLLLGDSRLMRGRGPRVTAIVQPEGASQ